MKNSKFVSLGFIALLLTGTLALMPTKAEPGISIYMDQLHYYFDTNTLGLGDKFNVTVYVDSPTTFKLMMFQVGMIYDHRYINFTQFWGETTGTWSVRVWPNENLEGRNFDANYVFYGATGGAIGNPAYTSIDASHGEVMVGDLLAAEKNVAGVKILARFEFEVVAVPAKGEELYSLLNINNADTYLYDSVGQIPGVTIIDSDYKLSWAVPPNAVLSVDPALVQFGPWPPSVVGEDFDINVYLDISAAWGLTTASFCLCYNTTVIDIIGEELNVTLNTAVWDPVTSTVDVVHGEPDKVNFVLFPIGVVGGKVLVATIKFTVMMQDTVPPRPAFDFDYSDLTFCDVVVEDHIQVIPTDTKPGLVKVLCLMALPLPYFEVYPNSIVLGPEPSIGTEFEVKVKVNDLHFAWFMIAYQIRLYYNHSVLKGISVTEGPFLQNSRWNLYGTYFIGYIDPAPWPITAGGFLLPNPATGEWDQTEFPNTVTPPLVDNTLFIVRFRVLKQCIDPITITLGLTGFSDWLLDKDGHWIPVDESKVINGTVTILPFEYVGRQIDVYGGALNRGYGSQIFPEPYGGQGLNKDMDLVVPQSVVYLWAYVTYNYWPVQSKDVGFEIDGPYEQEGWSKTDPQTWRQRPAYHVRKYSNRTSTGDCDNPGGVAWVKFQMPWPCDNPEDYFGKYRVTATVDICGVVVTDVLWFDYYYLVEIIKVTTDKICYEHCNDVKVTVAFRSKAQQPYPVLFALVLQDELETHVSYDYKELFVVNATFCSWKYYTFEARLHVEKWAFAGYAHIYVSAFDKDPTIGGAPWCPTFGLGWPPGSELPTIYIMPY